ncbi:adenylate kinase 8 isoform X1 [Empidonax traillii]|uniref:adenylate kinase 8 isoform X1 n=1 Tax=Empidonax traillii TaxID=164674 RepID=UPI000FFD6053|nr:adenylate kinase 8 isoform X1 [Empidonax traillii]
MAEAAMEEPAQLWPPPVGTYAEERGLFQLLQNMLEELLIHKPDDPIEFMINHLKQNNDDAPKICVLGPPASGKTTVAMWLSKHFDAIRVSQETLLFKETLALTEEAKAYKEKNQKIPNALWANLIQERLSNVDCIKQGWILEGFPENQEQAWMLQSFGIFPRHVVMLYASDTVLIERNSGKRLDPLTQEVYHTTFEWPSDPLVQQRLVKPDDLSEQEVSKKLLEYHRNFPEVFQIYQKVLKSINADQPSVDVLSQVLTYVQSRHRSAAPFTPRIIFCGPPGSGKSLQAALIAQKYGVVNICCGQLLKEAVADNTNLGELIKPYIDNGWPVPDNLVLELLTQRLSSLECLTDGWVLSGFPRDIEQAEKLHKAQINPNSRWKGRSDERWQYRAPWAMEEGKKGYFSLICPTSLSWSDCPSGGRTPSLGKGTTPPSDQLPPRRSRPGSGRTPETRKKILRSAWKAITGMSRTWRISMRTPFMSMLTKTLMLSLSS